eukprot:CAMPEP_0185771808 /NCGR_PEP_ID=MMETSP1174-20130828/65248_1 /TAXON_ID=35687 /ORGANISM="Dictyocha speculum, Strain CCMP1381" /LENGTH=31 /DNA_ID= /DNA_START= /DNA_END= /DNA_ORIENTATION=
MTPTEFPRCGTPSPFQSTSAQSSPPPLSSYA